jgi:hypothetical protein
MRRIPIPLLLPVIVIAFPVAVPIAIVLYIRDRRRMRVVAERTHCECCGATLGVASLRGADAEWTRRAAALQQDAQPMMMRLRLVRHVWAICAACGAEYDFNAGARTFHRVGGSGMPDDAAKVGAP